MRAVLIVNPNATSTTRAGRDLLAHALASRLDLVVEHTRHRGHAIELGQAASADGVDLVIAHGGDGTVHGVVNGLLGSPGPLPPRQVPAVAVVPGGSANVFARSLGIPADPTEATNQLIRLLNGYQRGHGWRRIGLIDCGERWAVLNAGMGIDGEVVAAVEADRGRGRTVTAARYVRTAVTTVLASTRRPPTLTVQVDEQEPVAGVHFAFVSNTRPWTYANNRPVWTNPACTFESGIGVFAVTSLKVLPTLRVARQMLAKRPDPRGAQLIRHDDAARIRVQTGDTLIATQIDGDYLGLRGSMTFQAVPDALNVVAPAAKNPF